MLGAKVANHKGNNNFGFVCFVEKHVNIMWIFMIVTKRTEPFFLLIGKNRKK